MKKSSDAFFFKIGKKNFFEEILFDYSNNRYPVERNQIKLKKEKKYGVHILIYTFIQKFIQQQQQQKCFTFKMKETRRNKKKIALFFCIVISVFLFGFQFVYRGKRQKQVENTIGQNRKYPKFFFSFIIYLKSQITYIPC